MCEPVITMCLECGEVAVLRVEFSKAGNRRMVCESVSKAACRDCPRKGEEVISDE